MTTQEKAKAYDEAFKEAEKIHKFSSDIAEIKRMEQIFPKLAESKDERIRKEIINYFQCQSEEEPTRKKIHNKWLAWLEKQGDKDKLIQELGEYKVKYTQEVLEKHINSMSNKDDERLRKTTIAFLKDYAEQGYENAIECIDWLEKQGNKPQKTSIWKHWKDGIAGNGEGKLIYLIKDGYTYSLSSCLCFECDYIELSELDKLLSEKQGEQNPTKDIVEIWKDMRLEVYQQASCNRHEPNYSDDTTKMFSLNDIDEIIEKIGEQKPVVIIPKFRIGDNIKTTNEEPLTITKIDGKGYWSDDLLVCDFDDAAKWELVEQKPAWSEEDEKMYRGVMAVCDVWSTATSFYPKENEDVERLKNWLKSLKGRVHPKQKWSEEDEKIITGIINDIQKRLEDYPLEQLAEIYFKEIKWLKSLRKRIECDNYF